MSRPGSIDSQQEGPSSIEALIRSARHYVQPSVELRPRVLEAAREHCADRQAEQRLGRLAIALLLFALVASPAMNYMSLLRPTTFAVEREVKDRAAQLEQRRDIGTHWALAEAFSQVRHLQASRICRVASTLE